MGITFEEAQFFMNFRLTNGKASFMQHLKDFVGIIDNDS